MRASSTMARAGHAVSRLAGYGSSVVLLAIASLAIIPVLIRSAGDVAWGAIALGQAFGAIAAVVVGYGWALHGPALVARGDAAVRRRAIQEALGQKLAIVVPVLGATSLVALPFATDRPELVVAGVVSAGCIGLTCSWYFVGAGQPYRLLLLETVPRVLGTVSGIGLLLGGAGAFAGIGAQAAGMLLAAVCSNVWIWRSTASPQPLPRRTIRHTLVSQVDGLSASTMSAVFVAAPLIIVAAVAPAIQPAYALVDKVQRQIAVGLQPVVSVLQGWVPRGPENQLRQRSRRGLLLSVLLSVGLGLAVLVASGRLVGWLGGGEISLDRSTQVLMGLLVGLLLLESFLSKALLPALDQLPLVSRATLVSALIGLPLVALGATVSLDLALLGLAGGLVVRLIAEVVGVVRSTVPSPPH